jgi:hypothetical protein
LGESFFRFRGRSGGERLFTGLGRAGEEGGFRAVNR